MCAGLLKIVHRRLVCGNRTIGPPLQYFPVAFDLDVTGTGLQSSLKDEQDDNSKPTLVLR